jgi:hypothetical protein
MGAEFNRQLLEMPTVKPLSDFGAPRAAGNRRVPLSPALLSAQIKRLVSGRLVHLWPYRRGFVCREWAHLLLGPFFRKRSGQPRGVRTPANADQYPGTTYSTSAVLRAPSYS